jgi:hypothetical protein
MSDPHAHGLTPNEAVGENDIVFNCPSCQKSLVIDKVAEGHSLDCPMCGKSIEVPKRHKVVTLAEAPETKTLQAKPAWEQDLIAMESSIKEIRNQREEAGNSLKKIVSEANRLKLRIEKLDAKLKDLEVRKAAIRTEHPQA